MRYLVVTLFVLAIDTVLADDVYPGLPVWAWKCIRARG